ncbi:MAG: hypothetical protein EAZ29_03490 [Runella slithyformis]|nr:MAG: hypothetical protein EAZ29_03490 [Runella slithyformis]
MFQSWQKSVMDYGAIPEKELVAQMWNGDKQPPITAQPTVTIQGTYAAINCATAGASVVYKILLPNTPDPKRWEVYTQPVLLKNGAHIKTIAQRIGYKPSIEVMN